ncbi:unnamed protein product, partial [Rotaria magnacalcarata]
RIGQRCVKLSHGTENLCIAAMNFLVEVLETTEVTRGLYEKELIDKTVEFNVPHVIHADMKRDEEAHRQHSEGIHQAARMTQLEYSRVLADIPTDFNVLGLELGRAVISLFKSFSTVISSSKNGRYLQKSQSMSEKHEAESLANNQILNFASCFAQSLDSLIERISSNESQTEHVNELQSFKAIFRSYTKMINNISNDKNKIKTTKLVQCGIQLVDQVINQRCDRLRIFFNRTDPNRKVCTIFKFL